MKKRFLTLFLALVLCLGLALPAHAAAVSDTAGQNFTQLEQKIYKALEGAILAVTAGDGISTEVDVPIVRQDATWTAQELGLSKIDNDNVEDPLDKVIGKSMDKVFRCLKANHPFEMFWVNNYYNWTRWQEHTDSQVWLTSFTCSIDVIQAYRGDSSITVDPAKIAQAKSVVKTAESIVAANAGKSNYEKLAAYRDEICALNTYNDDANNALLKDEFAYGDPWQLVYVFDGDPSTNALCEGYAKAFKYLCDLSEFDGDVTCYIVEGYEGSERHMWNVVRMEDGNFYLADITYLDTGAPASLFLASASGSGQEYTVSAGSQQFTYTYLDDQEGLFTEGFLPISSTAYVPGSKPPAPAFTDLPDWCAKEAQWAAANGIAQGTGNGKFSPGSNCTHEQILTFLYRAVRSEGAAAAEDMALAVQWAREEGMIGASFNPKAPCTRADAVTYIWQALGSHEAGAGSSFTDVSAGADYAAAVAWAVENGVTNGFDNGDGTFQFRPDQTCTRGQIACFLYRAYV